MTDNPYYRELAESRGDDADYMRRYLLGSWEAKRNPPSNERLYQLTEPRKAEFVRIEETVEMAIELIAFRATKAAKKPESGFICGAWAVVEQGPILNYERPYRRARYVRRCDLPDGHEGDHVDSVLLVNWSGDTPEQAAGPKPVLCGVYDYADLRCERQPGHKGYHWGALAGHTAFWCRAGESPTQEDLEEARRWLRARK